MNPPEPRIAYSPVPKDARPTRDRSEVGGAYVAVMLLLCLASILALTLTHQIAVQSAGTGDDIAGLSASYLADAALSHAKWRIFNEPTFSPDSTVYYMHSLGTGRYGYKVRMPTATTFATIAAVGAVDETHVAKRSSVMHVLSQITTVYNTSGSGIPSARRLVGASWDPPIPTVETSDADNRWLELEGNPFGSQMVAGIMDGGNELQFAVWDGVNWGNYLYFSGTLERDQKSFDVAYESQSGDALVLGRYPAKGVLYYTIWNGKAWNPTTPQQAFFNGAFVDVRFVAMESDPLSDEILIAVLDHASDIRLWWWDGNSFHGPSLIESDAANDKGPLVDIAFEQISGDAIVVWGESHSLYRFWTWSKSSGESFGTLPIAGGKGGVVRMDPSPVSDYVLVTIADDDDDLQFAVWDGNSWIDWCELETEMDQNADHNRLICDVAWEYCGDEALVVWQTKGVNSIQYMRWNPSVSLASPQIEVGPDFVSNLRGIHLRPIKSTDKLVLLGVNNARELRYALWTGTRFVPDPAILLENTISDEDRLAFDIAQMGQ